MTDVERLFERQALWQRSRRTLSWPEKIRLAERIRPTVQAFRLQRERRTARDASATPAPPRAPSGPTRD